VYALDGVRGVLATVVVFDHALTELGSAKLGIAASLSVTVFFLLSGLVLTRGWNGNFAVFLLRRFIRLWPVFAICLAAAAVLARRMPALLEFFWIPWPRYDANLFCPPLWSLFIEAWAALVMPAIVWSSRGGVVRSVACIVACVAVALFWNTNNLALHAFLCYVVCFVAGAALSRLNFRSPLLESAVPQFLGRISYSLYLTHWLVLRALTQAFGWPGTLIGIPLSFVVAWGIWWAVEAPSIRLSRAVASRRQVPAGEPSVSRRLAP
jgi:peptidoglycan/LPS O-acetylase OafA/YrhL